MTSRHPAQGSPSESLVHPEADGDVGTTEHFSPHFTEYLTPPPLPEEVFPAAMFAVSNAEVMASLPPGHPSGPVPVVALGQGGVVAAVPPPPPPPPPEPPRRRRTALLVGAVALVVAGSGGAAVYALAHKTVTLDVDGEITTVETFEGDVSDLLTHEGIEIDRRDAVSPGMGSALEDGGTVIVRSGHQVTLRADGERRTAWVTALDADQALATLSTEGPTKGDDVVLLPTRAEGTATLPMRLDVDGPVNLVAGGEVRRLADGALTLEELLARNDVRVDADDRITVQRGLPDNPDGTRVTVVVQDVQATIVESVSEVPFETVTATDPNHYEDLAPYVATEGVVGERVTSWDVIKVDGEVVEKEKLSTWVAERPVDKVIMYGTKARPEPEPEPEPDEKSGDKPKPDERSGDKPKPDDEQKATDEPKADDKPEPEPDKKPEPRSSPDSTTRDQAAGR